MINVVININNTKVCMCCVGSAMADGVDLSRKFVSESELDEKRKKRQEEWEKVRKPDDPEGETFTLSAPIRQIIKRLKDTH